MTSMDASAPAARTDTGVSLGVLFAHDPICHAVRQACRRRYPSGLRAAILTGSLGRNEGSFVTEGVRWRLLGDAEFLLVFETRALPPAADVHDLQDEIERDLRARGIQAKVGLAAVHRTYLARLRPHIFAYELRTCGQVVTGDPGVLDLIPAFLPADIPLEDGWRLLCNRLVEHLDGFRAQSLSPSPDARELHYRTVKLYLDMATSLLLFLGEYEPSYRARARKLLALARAEAPGRDLPFALPPFAARVEACTRWKLDPASEPRRPWTDWEEAIALARQLWRWELRRLTGLDAAASDRVLWRAWMRRQPLSQRARGWLFVARAEGWLGGWRHWPRWLRLAWRGSPRHWTYSAAVELLFGVFGSDGGNGVVPDGEAAWEGIRSRLPVIPGNGRAEGDWWWAAEAVAWNYERFLVPTRA